MFEMTSPTDLQENMLIFQKEEYDITDYGCQALLCLTCPIHFMPLFPGVMGNKRLVLDEEEAWMEVKCGLCNLTTRRPYGELGSVDKVHCLCCVGVSSELSKNLPLYRGWGCDDQGVSEIVAELKKRMKARGDTGQIRKTEMTLQEIEKLRLEMSDMRNDMKALLAHFNIEPTKMPEMER